MSNLDAADKINDGYMSNCVDWSDNQILMSTHSKLYLITFPPDWDADLNQTKGNDSLQKTIEIQKFPNQMESFFEKNYILVMKKVAPHFIVIGTRHGGLIFLNKNGEVIRTITKNKGLIDNFMNDVYQDNRNNLWLATNRGLSYVEISSPFTFYSDINGLSGFPFSLFQHRHALLVSTSDGIFYLPENKQIHTEDNHQFRLLQNNLIGDFLRINHTWLGIGVGIFMQKSDELKFTFSKKLVGYCLLPCPIFPDYVFAGGLKGLFHYTIKKNADQSIELDSEKEIEGINGPIRKLVFDKNRSLWVTSEFNGVYRLTFGDTIADYSVRHFTVADGLPTLNLNAVCWVDDRLLVCTAQGIYQPQRIQSGHAEKIHFVPDNQYGSQFSNGSYKVMDLLADEKNRIWINCADRVFYGKKNSRQQWEMTDFPFRRLNSTIFRIIPQTDGITWLLSYDGLFRFEENTKQYTIPYKAMIRKVIVKSNDVIFHGNYTDTNSPGSFLLNQPDGFIKHLPFQSNSISFEFSAPFFEEPAALRFSYRLQGFNEQWSAWQNKYSIDYTNLPKGSYGFEVKASNIFQQESLTDYYRFYIHSPWYQTIYAYAFFLMTFAGIVVLFGKFYNYRLIHAKNRLERIVTERTADLKAARDVLWGEMELAKKIQTVLLPKNPKIPGYQIAAYMQPADEVGGDYYDVIEIKRELLVDSGQWFVEPGRAKELDREPCRGGSCAHPHDSGQLQGADPTDPRVYAIRPYNSPTAINQEHIDNSNNQRPTIAPTDSLATNHQPLTTGGAIHELPQHWLSIGDVSGHGVPAGLVMMMVQTAIRAVLEKSPTDTPDQILASVNRVIHENIQKLGEDKYMTIILMSIQPRGEIYYSGLHQDLLIYRAQQKEVEVLESKGMWIGMAQNIGEMLEVSRFDMQTGDTLLLYTDGITEALGADKTMFSEKQLQRLFGQMGQRKPQEIIDSILRELAGYTCEDDITLMVIQKI
jgi:serine phosphatase RsbU (regulator of sigma subunit)